MKSITKLAMVIGILLQISGHPVEKKTVGWDYCVEPDGHPFIFYGYKYGWPAPFILVGEIWGCLTTPNRWISFDGMGLIISLLAWAAWLSILEGFWPVGVASE